MKLLNLNKGYQTMVDDEDYENLSKNKWYAAVYKTGYVYAVRGVRPTGKHMKQIRMHRQILGVTDPETVVDHKDGNTLNNQRSNLRICSYVENCRNRRKDRRKGIPCSSQYKGVSLVKSLGRYMASIKTSERWVNLGYFNNEIDAAIVYNEAAKIHHGEFARLNVIPEHKPNNLNKTK